MGSHSLTARVKQQEKHFNTETEMSFPYPLDETYQMIYAFQEDFGLWILLFAVIFGFVLSFAVGANDSANSWGTPVGAGTVSFGVAVFFGALMETLGAMVLSAGVVNMELYQSDNETEWNNFKAGRAYLEGEKELMLGMLSSMLASQVWQLTATYLSWPVSGTHAIISALLGFTLVQNGADGVKIGEANPFCASGIYKVVYGLFISSFVALVVGLVLYYLVYKFAISSGKARSLRNRVWFSSCVFIMFTCIGFSMSTAKSLAKQIPTIIESSSCMDWNKTLFGFLIGLTTGTAVALPFHFLVLDRLLKSTTEFRLSFKRLNFFTKQDQKENIRLEKIDSLNNVIPGKSQMDSESLESLEESPEIKNVFRPLQFIVACFAALNHGGNDVGNCIGPPVTVWFIYRQPLDFDTSKTSYIWLAWGGIGISLGLFMFGKRVIMTMGTKITPMTPSLGFIVVLSASLVVMICSFLGIPTSTTHCQVMAVVGGGIARGIIDTNSIPGGLKTVDLKVFRNIGLSWLVTIPASMAISAGLYAVLRVSVIGSFS